MEATAPAPECPILYRDDHLVVVNKPSGLAVHKGWARDRHYALTVVRNAVGCHVHPPHRLDKPTSGALVMALSREMAGQLQAAFAARRVDKRYLTLVRGVPPEAGVIDHPIKPKGAPVEDGQEARTEFRRLFVFRNRYSWVEVTPRTGRLHQIRRHLRHIDCPLIGDVKHGDGRHNRLFREEFGLHRLALHAATIAFEHPVSGARVMVQAPIPEDLSATLREFGVPPEHWTCDIEPG